MAHTVVLAYHDLSPAWRHELAIKPEWFAWQVRSLSDRGFTGVTLSALATGSVTGNVAVITFDDGFRSVLEDAKPVLDELGWPATVFAVTAGVGSAAGATWLGAGAAQRALLGWGDLEVLVSSGWEIGSHGQTHRLLSQLDDGELAAELEESRRTIERRLGSCRSISYPWGEVVDRVVDAARRAGYVAGSGLAGRFVVGDPLRVPRFAVSGSDGRMRFGLKTSETFRAFRRTPGWTALTALRRPKRPLGVDAEKIGFP